MNMLINHFIIASRAYSQHYRTLGGRGPHLQNKMVNKIWMWNNGKISIWPGIQPWSNPSSLPILSITWPLSMFHRKPSTIWTDWKEHFFWPVSNKVTSVQYKVNWEMVCRPKYLGVLGILCIGNFFRAIWLKWLWHENELTKIWMGMENLYMEADMNLCYAATNILVGNEKTRHFTTHRI